MQTKSIPIFMATDDNYAHLLLTSILSIANHTKEHCSYYILDGGISPEKRTVIEKALSQIPNIDFSILSMEESIRQYGFLTTGHITMPTYYRFFIADTFPQIEKAIYLDVDVIFQGDIKTLFDIELGEYVIAAAREQTSERSLQILKKNMNMSADSVYFNCGVMLMNLSEWREKEITQKLLAIEKEHHGKLILNDEDVLNSCFENNFLYLGEEFNAIIKYNAPCIIRHYAGFPKPWEIKPDLCCDEFSEHGYFWDYLKKTEFYEEVLAKCKYNNAMQLKKMSMMKKIMMKQEAIETE